MSGARCGDQGGRTAGEGVEALSGSTLTQQPCPGHALPASPSCGIILLQVVAIAASGKNKEKEDELILLPERLTIREGA